MGVAFVDGGLSQMPAFVLLAQYVQGPKDGTQGLSRHPTYVARYRGARGS